MAKMSDPLTREDFLGLIFMFSGLLCFGLPFTLTDADGRPVLFGVTLRVACTSLAVSKRKLVLIFSLVLFLLFRLAWALVGTRPLSQH